MHDPWIERLSEYIDGDLSAGERSALEAHLSACDECRAIVADLRQVVGAAATLQDEAPARDLWQGIAARIGSDSTGVVSLATKRAPRRISFSMAQLAAAAVLVMALTGTAVWVAANRTPAPVMTSGTVIQTAGSARTVAAQPLPAPEFTDDVTNLERALEENRAQLDPATVEVIERSLESIDRAIVDARAALESDPGNPYLHRQLDNTMRKKVDILRRATRAS